MLNDFGSDDPNVCFWRFTVRFIPTVILWAVIVYGTLFLVGWLVWRAFQ